MPISDVDFLIKNQRIICLGTDVVMCIVVNIQSILFRLTSGKSLKVTVGSKHFIMNQNQGNWYLYGKYIYVLCETGHCSQLSRLNEKSRKVCRARPK